MNSTSPYPGLQPEGTSTLVGIRLSVMMFLQFFVWGAWYVSMTGWMSVAGISGLISWAYTVGPIAAVISPFFLGAIADRFFATQRVLSAMHLLGGVFLIAIPQVVGGLASDTPQGFTHPFVLLALAHMLCYMPTLGLTNSLSFHHMSNPEKQFPIVRVFGTIGWIAGNLAVSLLPEGDKSPHQFYLAGGAGLLLGLYSLSLPHTPPPAAGKNFSVAEALGLRSLRLLAQPSYAVFAVCSLLICIPLAGYYAFARNFVEHVGFAKPTTTMSFGQMSEIIFMILMPAFFARLGVKWMLAVGMFAWVVRYYLFAAAAPGLVQWMTLGGILLHGICYDFFFVTGFIYVDRVAPKELRGQAQGFLVLITQGLGLGLGAQAFGFLKSYATTKSEEGVETLDWQLFWTIPAVFAFLVLLLFIALFRDRDRPQGNHVTEQ
ncbi:MAG: MFS transporter [Phycisphaerae bacterium]|nr:MFS transporter [Phycisphaerae bacterium]